LRIVTAPATRIWPPSGQIASKNPSTTFFWNDWDNDKELAACSLAAQGLWMRLLCIAARSPEPGVVQLGSLNFAYPEGLPQLAAAVGRPPKEIARLVDELLGAGAASLDDQGRLLNRRMVRQAELSRKRSNAASKRGSKPPAKPQAKPPPSSRLPDSKTPESPLSHSPTRASIAQPVPDDWQPSESARQQLRMARPDLDEEAVERRLLEFRNWCAAKALTTHNADATWLNFMMRTHAKSEQASRNDGRSDGLTASLALLAGVGREGAG
jgi:hypothetical protein